MKNKCKILLDIIMTIAMVVLLDLSITGVKWHEVLGIGVLVSVVMHILLNFRWVKSITANLFNSRINVKTRIMYGMACVLLVLIVANVVSGLLISTYILPGIQAKDIAFMSNLHHMIAYALVIVLVAHVGIHWRYLTGVLKIKKDSIVERLALALSVIVVAVFLLKGDVIKKLVVAAKNLGDYDNSEEVVYDFSIGFDDNPKLGDGVVPDDSPKYEEEISGGDNKADATAPTLEEYLSKLVCTGCGRGCLLINPACSTGVAKQQQEIQKYNQMYGTEEAIDGIENFGNGTAPEDKNIGENGIKPEDGADRPEHEAGRVPKRDGSGRGDRGQLRKNSKD